MTEPPEPTYAPTTEGGYEYPTAAPPDAPTAPEYEPGTRIPVRLDGRVYTLPVERLKDAQALGAVPMTEQEWGDHQAKIMAERQAAMQGQQAAGAALDQTFRQMHATEAAPWAAARSPRMEPPSSDESVEHSCEEGAVEA